MKITPYRVLFEVDSDSDTGKYRYGKPTSNMLPVEFSEEDSAYLVKTHDRGNHEGPGPFYQIAFRIEDPEPYTFEEIELHIDSAIYRNENGVIKNDLYCDPEDRSTANNLWYQRSRYERDGNGDWRIVNDTKKKALVVDCITTSGVFRVVAVRKRRELPNVSTPWIYVLPSSVSIQNYRYMLNDLINLHDSLFVNPSSTAGIGEITAVEADTLRIKKEIELTEELGNTIKAIISSPSELQKKEYGKIPLRKIHYFNSKVIREYIKTGSSGKVLGVTFREDHDTYENRVIKHVLTRIQAMYRYKAKRLPAVPENIDRAVEEEFERRKKVIKASKQNENNSPRSFSFNYRAPKYENLPLEVKIQENEVSMTRHAPFSVAGKHFVKLTLRAKTKREIKFFLDGLLQTLSNNTKSKFDIECIVLKLWETQTSGNNNVCILTVGEISAVNGKRFDNTLNDISDDAYDNYIRKLCSGTYGKFFKRSKNDRFNIKHETGNKIGIEPKEAHNMEAEIRADLLRKKKNAIAYDSLLEKTDQLKLLLTDPWFSGISDLPEILCLRPSAKFVMNKHYSIVYRIITEMMADHSTLASNFDINAFGVSKTEQVYEYWVFYRLLYQLQSIGFKIQKEDSLINHYRKFIQGRANTSKSSNYSVKATRQLEECEVCIEIGYEKTFEGYDIDGKKLKRTPDYYLRVKSESGSHWYFIDAKYKCFSKTNRGKVNYLQEIYDVALSKYIADMEQIFKTSDGMGEGNDICGAYIVMADVDDHSQELSETNRLFGSTEGILSEEGLKQWDNRITTDLIDISTEHLPCHRYGAIHLTPDHVDELQSLLELIFEYLETGKKDDHPNLLYCWRCGSSQKVNREQKETENSTETNKYYKYYATCPKCLAFRSDNHCRSCGKAIIKHTKGNFHKRDESVDSPQWAFLCPDCGASVKGLSKSDETKLDRMENGGVSNRTRVKAETNHHASIRYVKHREYPQLDILEPPPALQYDDFFNDPPF